MPLYASACAALLACASMLAVSAAQACTRFVYLGVGG